MPWLRIDDGFAEHHKIAALTDRELRVWLRMLCYAARQSGREGRLSRAMRREIPQLNGRILARFQQLGLLDPDQEDGVLVIHDWNNYNPTDPSHAARQAAYRRRKRDGKSDGESDAASDAKSDAPRAGTRARPVPNPSPKEKNPPSFQPELQDVEGGKEISNNEIDALRLNPLDILEAAR